MNLDSIVIEQDFSPIHICLISALRVPSLSQLSKHKSILWGICLQARPLSILRFEIRPQSDLHKNPNCTIASIDSTYDLLLPFRVKELARSYLKPLWEVGESKVGLSSFRATIRSDHSKRDFQVCSKAKVKVQGSPNLAQLGLNWGNRRLARIKRFFWCAFRLDSKIAQLFAF